MAPAIGMFFAKLVISMLVAKILQKVLQKTPDVPDTSSDSQRGIEVNARSTKEPLRVVYGKFRVGGNDVYATTKGANNRYLWIVQTLSEGVCDSIAQDGGVDQIWIDDKLWTEFTGYASLINYTFHDGSASQTVDTNLNAADSAWTDTLRNTCNIVWKFTWDEDQFRSLPSRQVELKGIECYDFRDESTAWSDNPVVCLYDFLTNNRYGVGIESSKIDTTSWTSTANYCDTQEWTLNKVVNVGTKNPWEIMKAILTHFRGTLAWFDGYYYLYYADLYEESSVMTIDDEHIVQGPDGKATVRLVAPGRLDTPQGMRVRFIDANKQYTEDDVLIGENIGLVEELDLNGCTNREQASNLATYALERAKLNRTITGTFRDDCIQLSPHDIVDFSCSALAISNQDMRVVETSLTDVGLINLTLQYESYELYDDDYDYNIEGTYTVDLPDRNRPSLISNPTISEQTVVDKLRTFQRLNIEFTVPDDEIWFKDVEVWQYITTSGSAPEITDYTHQFNSTNDFSINGVEQGQTYYIMLRTRNTWGVKQPFTETSVISKTVEGKSDSPTSLSALYIVPMDSGVALYADKLLDPDIEIYEFRLGQQFSGGIFMASLRSPNLALRSLKPGTHTFTCNTRSTNNIYGETPVSATCTIQSPKGWSAYTTFTDDYTSVSGVFDNTEHITYNGDDWLKCSHSGTNYSGSYTSPIFDVGSGNDDTFFTYISCDFATIGQGTTWSGTTTSGTTWEDWNADTQSWADVLEINEAPKVSMYIDWKLNELDEWSTIEKAEVFAGVVNSRYFRVRIDIEDPSSEVYVYVENYVLHLLN